MRPGVRASAIAVAVALVAALIGTGVWLTVRGGRVEGYGDLTHKKCGKRNREFRELTDEYGYTPAYDPAKCKGAIGYDMRGKRDKPLAVWRSAKVDGQWVWVVHDAGAGADKAWAEALEDRRKLDPECATFKNRPRYREIDDVPHCCRLQNDKCVTIDVLNNQTTQPAAAASMDWSVETEYA